MKNTIKPLVVKPIAVPKGYLHPNAPHDQLMNHEFTLGLIAPKGAGKTTVICNLLSFYRGYFHTILVFSPTIDSDEKWDVIKKEKLLVENLPLKNWLRAQEDKRKIDTLVQRPAARDEFKTVVDLEKSFSPTIPEDCFFHDYSDDTFQEIMEEQLALIKLLKKHKKPKFLANRILIIFDDLVGSSLFAGSRGSYFKGVNTRHRHYSASFIMVSQGYKEVPKTIRNNWTGMIAFEIGNDAEVQVIYEEWSMGLCYKDWLELYRYATDGDHSFLYINFQKPKRLRLMKNFAEYLFVE